jgi:uncharacterized protein (TIGR03086 family)
MHPLVVEIDAAVERLGSIVAAIDEASWAAPTPCAGWTVRDVANHTVGGMNIFAAELTGSGPVADHDSDWLGDDPVGAFGRAAERDRRAWRQPDALTRTVSISLGQLPGETAALVHLTELLAHVADIAVATGQEGRLDEAACERLLDRMAGMGGVDAFRVPGVFGPAVAAPAGAPAHVRLLAYLGRKVGP